MGKSKIPRRYWSSDFHFSHDVQYTNKEGDTQHRGIITFERNNFNTIEEHDKTLAGIISNWSTRWAAGSTFYFLGDWGNTDYLWTMDLLRKQNIYTICILGNHDSQSDIPLFEKHFDEVYKYPIYLSNKLVLSHEPQNVWPNGQLNLHGHLHGSRLDSINHINCNIHVAGYKAISEENVANSFSKMSKYCTRFLFEDWADKYIFTQPKDDVVTDMQGKIDLSASRLLFKLNHSHVDPETGYAPYTGGIK